MIRYIKTVFTFILLAIAAPTLADEPAIKGVMLGDLTWVEAEKVLGPETVVVIPLGAGSKEHGPHLRLDNDATLADYYLRRVLAQADVVIAPTINYHCYPAFLQYPGSTHLSFETSRDMVVDIARSLARYDVRHIYVLNTGVSTNGPLRASAEILAKEGILLSFTNVLEAAKEVEERVSEQERGTHADELETSMILYMAPNRVDMSKAVRDDNPYKRGGLTRDPNGEGIYSASGVWGDATLATREKGEAVVEATLVTIFKEIEELRTAELPIAESGN